MSSQMLNEQTFAPGSSAVPRSQAVSGTMTLAGTIVKSLALLVVAMLFGAMGWRVGLEWFSASSGLWWIIGYFLLIGLTIAAVSNPVIAPLAGLAYAILMGFWMGAVSRVYDQAYSGIVTQALLATVCAFLACLVLYLSRAVRVTPRLTRLIIAGTLGICLLYSVAWILSIFGINLYFWNNPTPLGIGMSIGICLLAAFNLFLDFAVIEKGIEREAPAQLEWYCAFGLLSTLVWLYAEILRLLALLRRAQ